MISDEPPTNSPDSIIFFAMASTINRLATIRMAFDFGRFLSRQSLSLGWRLLAADPTTFTRFRFELDVRFWPLAARCWMLEPSFPVHHLGACILRGFAQWPRSNQTPVEYQSRSD